MLNIPEDILYELQQLYGNEFIQSIIHNKEPNETFYYKDIQIA